MTKTNLKCKKCPWIKGDTYCDYHKKQIWKEDDMCEQGYIVRIEKGVLLCIKVSKENPDDIERIDKIDSQVRILDEEWNKRFGGKEDETPIAEPVPEPECPF